MNRAQDWDGVAEAHLSYAPGKELEEGAILAFQVIAAVVGVVPAAPAWNRVTASASLGRV